jgi:RHS repeat-associated protein
MNGDGLLDVYYSRTSSDGKIVKGLFLNNGASWSSTTSSLPDLPFTDKDGLDLGVRLLSVTGKGVTDIIQSFEGTAPDVELNEARRANILESVTDGLGLITNIWYQTLLEIDGSDSNYGMPANKLSDRIYERGRPAPFPLVAPVPTTYAVRRVVVDEGNDRVTGFSYRYGGYRVDNLAMRSLGFAWRESLNEINNVISRSEMVQDARLRNSIRRQATCVIEDQQLPTDRRLLRNTNLCPAEGGARPGAWAVKLTESVNCWLLVEGTVGGSTSRTDDCGEPESPNGLTGAIHVIRQINLEEAKSKSFELDGTLVSELRDVFEYDLPSDIIHRHGNVLKTRSELADGTYVETVNEYQDDEARWFLGRLVKTTITKVGDLVVGTAPRRKTEIRHSAFGYDLTTGLIAWQSVNAADARAITSTFERDARGNILKTVISALGESVRTNSNEFDFLGRFPASSANALGQMSLTTNSPTTGKPLIATDPNGLVTKLEYDGFGRLRQQTSPNGIVATTKILSVGELSNLALGPLLTGRAVAYGIVTQVDSLPPNIALLDNKSRDIRVVSDGFTSDAGSHRYIYKDTDYDLAGRVARTSLPYEKGKPAAWITNDKYDVMNRVLRATNADGLVTETTYEGSPGIQTDNRFVNCTASASDSALGGGTVTVTIDPGGKNKKTTSRVNMRKQLIYSVDAAGGCVSNEYDAGGRVETVKAPEGAITSHSYDSLGFRVRTSDPDLGVWRYEYDAFGHVRRQVDAKNQIATMEYDALDRPIKRVLNDVTTTWNYDNAKNGIGKIASIISSNGLSENYYYDRFSRPIRKATIVKNEQFAVSTDYDDLGRASALYYPDGLLVRNVYDDKGFLTRVQNGQSSKVFWSAEDIDIYGRVVREKLGNGVLTTKSYDDLSGRPVEIKAVSGSSARIMDLKLQYDKIGNLAQRVEEVEHKVEKFRYDDLDRLRGMVGVGGRQALFNFDAAGRLTFKSGVGAYHYRRPRADGIEDVQNTDHWLPLHAVVQTTSGKQRHQYRYDRNGNMVGTPTERYEYTSDNKLKLIYYDDKKWAEFEYGSGGDRFRQLSRQGDLTTETIYVGSYERVTEYVPRVSAGHIVRYVRDRDYISNGSAVVAVVESDSEYANSLLDRPHRRNKPARVGEILHEEVWYLHADQLGSILRITNVVGAVRDKIWYDPWGLREAKEINKDDEGDDLKRSWTRGFTGHEHLDAFSLIHMNGRVYHAALSIFLTVDTLNQMPADTQSGNGYMYARGNPIRYIDPLGQGLFDSIGNFFTGIGKGIWGGIQQIGRGIGDALSGAGKWLAENWRTVVIVVAVVVVTVVTAGAAAGLAGAILTGMAAGATSGALSAALYGGNLGDVLAGAITGALIGAVTGAATYGATVGFASLSGSTSVGAVAGQGVVGGASEAIRGGDLVPSGTW